MDEFAYRIKLYKKGIEPFLTYYTYDSFESAKVAAKEFADADDLIKAEVLRGHAGQIVSYPKIMYVVFPQKKTKAIKKKIWMVSSNSHLGWIREGEFFTKKEAEEFVKSKGGKSVGLVDYEIWRKE